VTRRPVTPRDLGRRDADLLTTGELQDLLRLPPPYEDFNGVPGWPPLSDSARERFAQVDGVLALGFPKPASPAEEEALVERFLTGLRKLLSADDNWAFLQPLQLSLEHCARCLTCSDACPIYTASGGEEIYRPSFRGEALRAFVAASRRRGPAVLRRLAGHDVPVNWQSIGRLAELAYRCTLCRRCAQACPIGVDNGLITHEIRKLFSQEFGLAPAELHRDGSALQLRVGSTTGMGPAALRDAVEFIDDEMTEKTGWPVATPIDKAGADILVVHNAGEFVAWPENPGATAVVLNAAGVSWTLSSELLGYDAVNYGLWYDDAQFARVALRHAQVAKKLGVKKIVIAECGHAHKALTVVADRIFGVEYDVPRESILTLLADLVCDSGRLKLDSSRNDFPVTLHDPCNIVRLMGIVEPQRRVVRAVCPDFREMTPHGVHNYCCGGGSGFAIMSPHNFADWRLSVAGRMKLKQVLEAFADRPDPTVRKYLCAPCSNCKGQLRDLLAFYHATERSGIYYGGLVELVANALADLPRPFLEWNAAF
jgi:Fe-S oxidoreductase